MAGVRVPVWTLGDRLRKAREDAGLSIQDMAEKVGYHRNSITAWEAGRPIKPGMVRAWADICNVSLEWLEDGTIVLHEQAVHRLTCNDAFGSFALRLFDPDGLPDVIDLRDHRLVTGDEKGSFGIYAHAS